jgi:hypothetical protein
MDVVSYRTEFNQKNSPMLALGFEIFVIPAKAGI